VPVSGTGNLDCRLVSTTRQRVATKPPAHAINAPLFSKSQHLWTKLQVHRGIRNHAELRQAFLQSQGSSGSVRGQRPKRRASIDMLKGRPSCTQTSSTASPRPPEKNLFSSISNTTDESACCCGPAPKTWRTVGSPVPADLNCAITPVSYQATDGSKDLAALGERSTMNTLQRILAYLFRAKPMGPLVIGWSYQNGQRAVFRLPH
jgi:hypothetical protein